MPSIQVPSALRSFTGGASSVEVAATTVRDALAELDRRHPGIAAKILDRGAVKPFIRIFVGPEDIGGLAGLETKLAERDELAIIPAIAGGRDAPDTPGVRAAPEVDRA
jgi:sulfur-carrier protein